MLLMQGLSLETNRIYRIYASYKASATPEAGAASQNLQIGIGQSGGTSLFENYSASDTKWHLAQFNITTDIPTYFLFAGESGTADGVGMMIDDIRLYDLGIPKLD
jgi:hypothetical protein